MKKILFVSNLFPRPDAVLRGVFNSAFISALHERLSAEGGRVSVVVPVADWNLSRRPGIRSWRVPEGISIPEGCKVHYVPCFHLPLAGRVWAWRFHLAALRKTCHALLSDCDAVIGSWLYPDAVAIQRLAFGAGKPCWIRLHGTDRFHLDNRWRGGVCRQAMLACNGIAVNAESMKAALIRRGFSGERVAVVPNGVDLSLFHPAGPQPERQEVLWIGHLTSIKGPDLAIRAWLAQKDLPTDSRLVMIGEGPMRSSLERLADREGGRRIVFAGPLGREALARRLRQSAALLLSSRSEGMPNVVLEALASGVPVVATAVGDLPHTLVQGENGLLVSPGSEEQTVQALSTALRQALTRPWDAAAIESSVADRGWEAAATRLLDAMRSGVMRHG